MVFGKLPPRAPVLLRATMAPVRQGLCFVSLGSFFVGSLTWRCNTLQIMSLMPQSNFLTNIAIPKSLPCQSGIISVPFSKIRGKVGRIERRTSNSRACRSQKQRHVAMTRLGTQRSCLDLSITSIIPPSLSLKRGLPPPFAPLIFACDISTPSFSSQAVL